ncbi:MAG: M23 family metallopeptidase [Flavobacteriales bacterium]|nr:M23 family metallopeptidase [Flavobacteriales bacterium]
MDLPIELSGNFMEPRNDHFHSGLDMRTQGREGIPVRAVADGWVSRIKISPFGYGKAVYIDHYDGHTTVYGHLQQLTGEIGEACLDQQYRLKDFSIDWTPEKGALPLKQGEVFALSGNTGGSGGPHLHFEVRSTGSQHALDPEAHGFSVADRVPPEIHGLRLFPLNDSSRIAPYPDQAVGYAALGGSGKYTLKSAPIGFGTVGIAVNTFDRYDNGSAKCGVRRIEVFVDNVRYFMTTLDHVDFSHNRYCNAHMDYSLFKGRRLDYHRCYKQPNNKLRIYGNEPQQGRIDLPPGGERNMRVVATDANGNSSELRFVLRGASAQEAASWPVSEPSGSLFRYDAANMIEEEGLRFMLPAQSLYDDAYVAYARKPAVGRALGPLHSIGDPLTPLHTAADLSLAVTTGTPAKALVVRLDADGSVAGAVGGKYADGWITAQVKSFGQYTVMLDTTPPVITNVDLRADMRGRKGFELRISDNLSGISSWRGTLNGDWILLEYDPKTKTLSHAFDKHSRGAGKKEFRLIVVDDRGNTSSYRSEFTH